MTEGPTCFFDMPSDVSDQELMAVKSEMSEVGLVPIETNSKRPSKLQKVLPRSRSQRKYGLPRLSKNWKCSCCFKNATSQVREPVSESLGGLTVTPVGPSVRVTGRRDSKSQPAQSAPPPVASRPDPPVIPALIKSRPAFDHPLEPPTVMDANVDYYAILQVDGSASQSAIKQAYHTVNDDQLTRFFSSFSRNLPLSHP